MLNIVRNQDIDADGYSLEYLLFSISQGIRYDKLYNEDLGFLIKCYLELVIK